MEPDIGSAKRQKLDYDQTGLSCRPSVDRLFSAQSKRPISPPLLRRAARQAAPNICPESNANVQRIASPFRLTRIRDLPEDDNADALCLEDLVGDPLIKECWHFNYLFDLDFVMSAFDEDTRNMVKVKIVHGSWREKDSNRQSIEIAARKFPNVQVIKAFVPDPFGTHHSKAMVLFRHDDTCQIIIHTANMITQDWTNLSQGIWTSPLLPLLKDASTLQVSEGAKAEIGTGKRFKQDLLRYFRAYGNAKTGSLVAEVQQYDFSNVRAAFIASAPGKERVRRGSNSQSATQTSWGWEGLRDILKSVPCANQTVNNRPSVLVMEVSSIASLGTDDTWISNFRTVLSTSKGGLLKDLRPPLYRIMFPTADEIRASLDGYDSGNSIHTRIQSSKNLKQLSYLRPMLCHWAGSIADDAPQGNLEAGRRRAAPHIKTYMRFTDSSMNCIDWAMLTSANLSTQAWGALVKDGEYKISSWEMGVVVWPELLAADNAAEASVVMVPLFKKDTPSTGEYPGVENLQMVVGLRMPYDLPLVPYKATEVPWCATMNHAEPDWMGEVWSV